MPSIIKYDGVSSTGKQSKKKQIILCHTSREVEEYLTSLKFRYNRKYDKIPNYVVTKDGELIKLLDDEEYSNIFSEENINKNSVIISLENLGWLEKKSLTSYYINWKGSIYNGEVYEKKWRDFFFWQPYTNSQLEVTAKLCVKLLKNFNINKKCIGHNTKIDGISEYDGVVSRSNFDTCYTDLNPSFNFEKFIKYLENE